MRTVYLGMEETGKEKAGQEVKKIGANLLKIQGKKK